jgi:hypothetical protein
MRKSICLGLIVGSLLHLYGCATIDETVACPASSTGVAFALQGSTVGNQLISMAGAAAGAAGFMARPGAAEAPTTTATMKYTYVPIFGSDSGSLTCVQAPAPPTIITTGPPVAILHQ